MIFEVEVFVQMIEGSRTSEYFDIALDFPTHLKEKKIVNFV